MWKDKSLNSWALKHVKDLLQRIDPVHFQYGMAHVIEVSTCNNNVTLQTIGRKRWVSYSFDITMKVKGEVCTTEGLEIP
jgi:activator of HSP90 ATPase